MYCSSLLIVTVRCGFHIECPENYIAPMWLIRLNWLLNPQQTTSTFSNPNHCPTFREGYEGNSLSMSPANNSVCLKQIYRVQERRGTSPINRQVGLGEHINLFLTDLQPRIWVDATLGRLMSCQISFKGRMTTIQGIPSRLSRKLRPAC